MRSKALNIGLWTVQILLAVSLTWSFYMKVVSPAVELAAMWPWTADNPGLTKFTGILDLVAAIGLVLPMALRIQPKLTVFAAYGFIVLMISAIVFHIGRGEVSQVVPNIAFLLMGVFIAWGRR